MSIELVGRNLSVIFSQIYFIAKYHICMVCVLYQSFFGILRFYKDRSNLYKMDNPIATLPHLLWYFELIKLKIPVDFGCIFC